MSHTSHKQVSPMYIVLLLKIFTRVPNVYYSAPENNTQQMHYLQHIYNYFKSTIEPAVQFRVFDMRFNLWTYTQVA